MIFRKNVKKGGGSFPIWKISLQIWCGLVRFRKKITIFFPEKGPGGGRVKGRSEIFRKFIDIGKDGLPLEVSWWSFSRPSHNSPEKITIELSSSELYRIGAYNILGTRHYLLTNKFSKCQWFVWVSEWILAFWLKACFVIGKILVKIVVRISIFFPPQHHNIRTWAEVKIIIKHFDNNWAYVVRADIYLDWWPSKKIIFFQISCTCKLRR